MARRLHTGGSILSDIPGSAPVALDSLLFISSATQTAVFLLEPPAISQIPPPSRSTVIMATFANTTLGAMKDMKTSLSVPPLILVFSLPVAAYLLQCLWSCLFSPLSKYPGPFLASKFEDVSDLTLSISTSF